MLGISALEESHGTLQNATDQLNIRFERENKSEMLNSGGFIFICSVYLLSIGIYLPVEVLTMFLALDKLGLYLSTVVVQFQCAWLC